MMIGFEKLSVMTVIGVFPHERVGMQELVIDLKVRTDLSICMKSDDIADALSYVDLAEMCQKIAAETNFNLIEAFAAAVIKGISDEFAISWIWIRVSKPSALKGAVCAFVEMERAV